MGSWSVKLYGSDFASDLKADFEFFSRLPGSTEALIARLIAEHPAATDDTADDHTEFWLVLADQLHRLGLDHAATFKTARNIIASGRDLEVKRALEMSARDLAKRQSELEKLAHMWAAPHPKPGKRKVLTKPEPLPFPAGSVLIYPTDHGAARNPYDTKNAFGWHADGWGSAIVLNTGHVEGLFGWVTVARLSIHGAAEPTLKAVRASSIETQPWWMKPDGEGTLALQRDRLPPAHVKLFGLQAIGQLELAADKVAKLGEAARPPTRPPTASLTTVLRWWTADVWTRFEMRDDTLASPQPAIALSTLTA